MWRVRKLVRLFLRILIVSKLIVEGRLFIGIVKRLLMSKFNCIDVIISKFNYRLILILVGVERFLISKFYFREGF